MRKLFVLLTMTVFLMAVLFLASCATTPISPQLARIVPPERILHKELLTPSSTRNIKVIITRDKGFVGGGLYVAFKIDGKDVAKLRPGEILTIYLEKGDYLFGIIFSPNLFRCYTLQETDVLIKASRTNNFRILTTYTTFSLERTSYH